MRVNDSDFVEAGTVLVRLDPQPFQVLVNQAKAAVAVARADLECVWRRADAGRAGTDAGLAYYDIFFIFSLAPLLLIPLVWLMKRPRLQPGAVIHGE